MNRNRKSIDNRPAAIVAGPTGVGKTQLCVALARRHGFELVSADSMQVYRGLEIGAAQPTEAELQGVPLHGCGVLAPDEPFNAMRFLELSDRARIEIEGRGRRPLYLGGTGLYLRALRWGLFEGPEANEEVRGRLRREAESGGLEVLREKLQELDPTAAGRIAPNDAVRVVRALEVIETTGRPVSSLQTQWDAPRARFPHCLIALTCPRATLVERIEKRVDEMLEAGWVDEVRRLLESGYGPDLHCFKALGYREIAEHLRGDLGWEEMRETIKAKTRQFAKRQMTWLRRERDVIWSEYDGISSQQALDVVEKELEAHRALP